MKDLLLKDNTIIANVHSENARQVSKWGIQDHEPFVWLGFATEELGELSQAISEWQFRKGNSESVVSEAIQTATLCLKIAEMFRDITNNAEHIYKTAQKEGWMS